MAEIHEVKKGDKLTLKFKEGSNNKDGNPTIISKSPCGRIALLHFDNPKSKQVRGGSTWECVVEMTFPKKIVVRAVECLAECDPVEDVEN